MTWLSKGKPVIRAVAPPIVVRGYRAVFPNQPHLFDGSSSLFIEALHGVKVYGEYGVGLSTLHVLSETDAQVVSVESDPYWSNEVQREAGSPDRLDVRVVDVGPVGLFGTPLSYRRRHVFPEYARALWRERTDFDLVLIDGRFRIACFAESYIHARAGTLVVFDDYVEREYYKIVEDLCEPCEVSDRQALFRIPENRERGRAVDIADEFRLVWL